MSTYRNRRSADAVPEKLQLILPIIFFGIGALVFCLLGCVYGWEGIEDLRRDRFEFAIGSSWGTDWHRSYSVADHPLLFVLKMSIAVMGAVGALGLGLFLFGALIWISTKNAGPRVKKMEALGKPWLVASAIALGVHFVFMLVPYFLAFIDVL